MGRLVGDALAPVPAAALVPHLPHSLDLPLSPSEPLISFSAPPHPCPAPPASRSIQHQQCLTRGCVGTGLRAPCAALLFCSSHVSPSSGGIQLHPLGHCTKSPTKRMY